MRRRAKVDANQPDIVKTFRQYGATVAHTHQIGGGFPDIVVGFRGENYMIEIKDGSKPPSARALTADESEFHATWRGSVIIIESEDDVHRFFSELKN